MTSVLGSIGQRKQLSEGENCSYFVGDKSETLDEWNESDGCGSWY